MRIELVAQHFQLRLLCHRHGREQSFLVRLYEQVILDAEIQHTPHQHHPEGRHRAREIVVPGHIRLAQLLIREHLLKQGGAQAHPGQRGEVGATKQSNAAPGQGHVPGTLVQAAQQQGETDADDAHQWQVELIPFGRFAPHHDAEVIGHAPAAPARRLERPEEDFLVL